MPAPSLSDKLLAAKVPQLLGTYLAVGFGLLQFVEFVSSRYTFSGAWVDRYLLLWLGLIPAVALLIYYRGLPQKESASGAAWKKGLIFVNVGLVALLLFFVKGTDGPTTETIAFVDDQGNTEERVIPSRAAVQRIAVFDFENESEDPENDWWGTAYGYLLEKDLLQRPEVITTGPFNLYTSYDRFGAEPYSDINVATQRKIAQRAQTDYFVSLEFDIKENGHQAKGALHRTKDGKAVQQLEASAADIYGVVDRLKEQIDAFLPPLGDLNKVDTELPSSSLITEEEEALKNYIEGNIRFTLHPDDPATAQTYFSRSIEQDPSCASCVVAQANIFYAQGQADTARVLFREAARLARVLPEREQFMYKFLVLNVNSQVDNAVKILEAYRSVFPYDWMPYQLLETFYNMSYGLDSTVVLMEQAAELSNREKALERLYVLHSRAENFPEVERAIDRMDEDFPDKNRSLMRRARLYQNTGEGEKAREVLNEMIALDPLNQEPVNQLIGLEMNQGKYAEAERLATQQLREASTATDSTTAWNRLIQITSSQGKIAQALESLVRYEAFIGKRAPRLNVLMQDFNIKVRFAMLTGNNELVDKTVAEIGAFDPQQKAMFQCLLPFFYATFDLERENLQEDYEACRGTLAQMGPMMAAYNNITELLLKKDFTAAADLIDEKEKEGLKLGTQQIYARINRKAGRLDKARMFLEDGLVGNPKDPLLHLEQVHLALEEGDTAVARESLDLVMETYKEADANFLPMITARELEARLSQ